MSDRFEDWNSLLFGGEADSPHSISCSKAEPDQDDLSSVLDDLDYYQHRPSMKPYHRSDLLRSGAAEFVDYQYGILDGGVDLSGFFAEYNPPLTPSFSLPLPDEVDSGTCPPSTTSAPALTSEAESPAEVEDVDPSSSSSPMTDASSKYPCPAEDNVNLPQADDDGSTGPVPTTSSSMEPFLVTAATVEQENVNAELPDEAQDIDPSSSSFPATEASSKYPCPAEVDANLPVAEYDDGNGPQPTTPSSTGSLTVATVKQENVNSSTTHPALPSSTPKPITCRWSRFSFTKTPYRKWRPTRVQRRRRRSRTQTNREVIDLTGDSDAEMAYPSSPELVPSSGMSSSSDALNPSSASSDSSSPSSPVFCLVSPTWANTTSPSSSTSWSSSESSFSSPSSPVSSFTSSGSGEYFDQNDDDDDESLPPLESVDVEPSSSSSSPFVLPNDPSHPTTVMVPAPALNAGRLECRHACRCLCSVFTPSRLRQTSADGNKKLLSESSRRKHERNLDLHPECQRRGLCAQIARSQRVSPVKRVKVE